MRNRYNLVGLYSGWACRNLSKIWTGVKCVRPFLSSCFSISFLSISSSCCPSSSLFVFTLRRRHSSSSPFVVVAIRRRPSSSPIIVVAFLYLSGPFRLYSGWACRNLSKIWTGVKCVRPFLSSCFSISFLSISSSCCPSSSLFVFTLRRRHSSSPFVVSLLCRPSSSLFFVALVVALRLRSSSSPFFVALVESTTPLCLLCVLRRVVS